MSDWYYTKDGKTKIGPISEAQLKELARKGQLQRTDMVLKDGIQKWMPASQIDGLFAANESSSQMPPSPPRIEAPVVLTPADSTDSVKKDAGKKAPPRTEQPKGILASIGVFANKAQAKIQETVQEVGGKVKDAVKDTNFQNAISGITGQMPEGTATKAPEKKKTQDMASDAQETVKDANVTMATTEAPLKPEPSPSSSESGATPGAPPSPSPSKTSTTKAPPSPPTPIWDENDPATWRAIQGHAGILDVYEDKVIITPQGVLGFFTRGLSGTCEVPYRSITAIQFREANAIITGYITFDVPGIVGGFRGDRSKSNTFIFRQERNSLMKKIKQYVEGRMKEINGRSAAPPSASSRADELMKLAGLLKDGHITQEEFTQMKADLLNQTAKEVAPVVLGPAESMDAKQKDTDEKAAYAAPPRKEKPKGFFERMAIKFREAALKAQEAADVRTPGRLLQQKFANLGTLKGKTKAEIVAAVGPPKAASARPGGMTILQWMATGYHIVLIFKGDSCEGVSHEAAV